MDSHNILVVAGAILLFGLLSRRLENSMLTPPLLFTGLGLFVGMDSIGLLDLHVDDHAVHLIAEVTLILVLFGDASRIDLGALKREIGLPIRLLFVSMPLTITLGGALALGLFPQLSVWEALLVGAILAPTDAALGQAVVSAKAVPQRIRQALNVESGLNDGIAVPVVLVFLFLSGSEVGDRQTGAEWLAFAAKQVVLGPLVGIGVGVLGGVLLTRGQKRQWMSGSLERPMGLLFAVMAFTGAEQIGGNGFIAAFAAGLTLGNVARDVCSPLYEFLEAEGQLLMLLVFLLFGVTMAWPALAAASLPIALYAAASLTLVRMLPVAASMIGSGLRLPSMAFLGWFGPRGLASILFVIVVVNEGMLANANLVFAIVVTTVLASIASHGVTAAPLAAKYGRMVARKRDTCGAELASVAEHPLRTYCQSNQTNKGTPHAE